jgi:hypothetical protein
MPWRFYLAHRRLPRGQPLDAALVCNDILSSYSVVLTARIADINPSSIIPMAPTPTGRQDMSPFALLMELDGTGLTEEELKGLLTRCFCGLYFTKRQFDEHHCRPRTVTVIDLTAD